MAIHTKHNNPNTTLTTVTIKTSSTTPTNSLSTTMAEGLKVRFTYKPDSSSTPEEYWVVANPGMPDKWKQDPSTPLTDVLQSFDVFKGHGQAGQAPHADLLCASQLFVWRVLTLSCRAVCVVRHVRCDSRHDRCAVR